MTDVKMTGVKRERRSSGRRVPVRVPVSIKSRDGAAETTGFTRDLNMSGVFLYTDSHISEGSELEMVLILPPELTQGKKQWVCCRASVVRVEDNKVGGELGVAASISSLEILPEISG
jgi:hypothetical protein